MGFTGGNNLGFAVASREFNPDYFLLLNADTLVQPDFLAHLLASLHAHPDWGLASPKIYFAPGCEFHRTDYPADQRGHVIWFAGGSIDWDNLLTCHRGVDEIDRGQFEHETELDFATGCCFLIRREVLATTGVFDDQYFLYYEDTDLSARLKTHGFKLGFVPSSIVWHKNGGATNGSGSDLQTFYQTRNRLHFFATYGNWRVRQRVVRLAWRLLRHGSKIEQLAAKHWFLHRLGKQIAI
ncbi:glycosyltransferase family 2 protein [bacterium]|nr:glycosyltransferase family 2 protein [bacterium]